MSLSDLIIRIRAQFDGKPIADASKSVGDLGKNAKAAGQSGEQAMNLMSTASAAANGNFSGVAEGVVRLTGKIKLLGMSMMQLSLVAATLTLLVKLFQAIAERADAMAAGLRQIKSDNVTNAIDQIKKSYDSMTEAAERATKSRNAMFEVDAQEIEAIHKKELAQIEYNKQVELGSAKTPEEKANIEAKYKSTTDTSNLKNETSQSGKKKSLLLAQADEAETAAQEAFDAYNAIKAKANQLMAHTSYAAGQASKEAQSSVVANFFTGGKHLKASEAYGSEASTGRQSISAAINEMAALKKTQKEKEDEADILRKQASIVTTESQASTLTYKAVTVADTRAARDRDAEARAAAQRKRLQDELDAAEERKNATVESRNETKQRLTFRASTEAAEAKTAQAAHSPRAAREVAESRAAAAAVAAYAAETTAILKQLEASMKAQRDALKRLPN